MLRVRNELPYASIFEAYSTLTNIKGYFLFDAGIRVFEHSDTLHLKFRLVGKLIAFLLEFHGCSQLQSFYYDRLHMVNPAEMLFLNVNIQSLLGNTQEIKFSVLVRMRIRLVTIGYICDTCTDHLDLQVCTILLPDALDLASGCRICLLDDQVWNTLPLDKGHLTSVTSILKIVTLFFLFC